MESLACLLFFAGTSNFKWSLSLCFRPCSWIMLFKNKVSQHDICRPGDFYTTYNEMEKHIRHYIILVEAGDRVYCKFVHAFSAHVKSSNSWLPRLWKNLKRGGMKWWSNTTISFQFFVKKFLIKQIHWNTVYVSDIIKFFFELSQKRCCFLTFASAWRFCAICLKL